MNTTTHVTPATDSDSSVYTDNGQRGMYLLIEPVRPAAPLVTWNDTGAITDLDPMTASDACPVCFNQAYECLCGGAE
jgi:hypothetical protein